MGIGVGTAFISAIDPSSIPDLNKINRVKTNNKNVMKIPVISVIKKFLYSSLQYHWCSIVLIVKLESIDSSSIHNSKKFLLAGFFRQVWFGFPLNWSMSMVFNFWRV